MSARIILERRISRNGVSAIQVQGLLDEEGHSLVDVRLLRRAHADAAFEQTAAGLRVPAHLCADFTTAFRECWTRLVELQVFAP